MNGRMPVHVLIFLAGLLSGLVGVALPVACTPAQVAQTKEAARTVVNVTEAGCAMEAVMGAILLTDAQGKAIETVCATEEELRPLINQLHAQRRAKALQKAKAMGLPPPDAGPEVAP